MPNGRNKRESDTGNRPGSKPKDGRTDVPSGNLSSVQSNQIAQRPGGSGNKVQPQKQNQNSKNSSRAPRGDTVAFETLARISALSLSDKHQFFECIKMASSHFYSGLTVQQNKTLKIDERPESPLSTPAPIKQVTKDSAKPSVKDSQSKVTKEEKSQETVQQDPKTLKKPKITKQSKVDLEEDQSGSPKAQAEENKKETKPEPQSSKSNKSNVVDDTKQALIEHFSCFLSQGILNSKLKVTNYFFSKETTQQNPQIMNQVWKWTSDFVNDLKHQVQLVYKETDSFRRLPHGTQQEKDALKTAFTKVRATIVMHKSSNFVKWNFDKLCQAFTIEKGGQPNLLVSKYVPFRFCSTETVAATDLRGYDDGKVIETGGLFLLRCAQGAQEDEGLTQELASLKEAVSGCQALTRRLAGGVSINCMSKDDCICWTDVEVRRRIFDYLRQSHLHRDKLLGLTSARPSGSPRGASAKQGPNAKE